MGVGAGVLRRWCVVSGVDLSCLPDEVVRAALAYSPKINQVEWNRLKSLLLGALIPVCPATPGSAKNTLRSLFRLVVWCQSEGLAATAFQDFMTAENVESYAASVRARLPKENQGLSQLESEVSRLRTIGRVLNPTSNWPALREMGGVRPLQAIYSDIEVEAMYSSITSCSDLRKKRIALAALALGLGAGLTAGEQQNLARSHIYQDQTGTTWVQIVKGSTSGTNRLTPVAAPWDSRLVQTLTWKTVDFDGWTLPIGRNANTISANLNSFPWQRGCPVLNLARARTTWMVQRMAVGVRLNTLAHYAGLSSLDTLIKAATMLPPQEQHEALTLMTRMSRSAR